MEEKEVDFKEVVSNLLMALGWATQPGRNGQPIPAEIVILRRTIKATYLTIGFTEEELSGQEFGFPET